MTHKEAEQGLSRLKEEVKQAAFPELNQIVGQASKGLLPVSVAPDTASRTLSVTNAQTAGRSENLWCSRAPTILQSLHRLTVLIIWW